MTPAALHGLFDDASLFPPASLPLDEAVAAHRSHRTAWYADAVGPFVAPAARLAELGAAVGTGLSGAPLPVAVTVPGGPVDLGPALAQCAGLDGIRLAAVELMLPDGVAPHEALAALDDHLPHGVTSYLEVPRGPRSHAVLDALAGSRHRAKFRTGGPEPGDHPGERELANAVLGAVSRGVPFKCTAGLHHAVRRTDGRLEQHGFLNVLLAADAAAQGAGIGPVASLLALRTPDEIARAVTGAGDRLAAARACFVSMGTCSIAEPVADLVALDLLRQPGTGVG